MADRRILMVAALGTLCVAAPAVSYAQTCGGNEFKTCASVVIGKSGGVNPGDPITLVITVTNNSGFNGTFAGTTFTDIGVWGLPSNAVVSSFAAVGSGAWHLGTPPGGLTGAGISGLVIGGEADTPQPQNGLKQNQSVTFTITFSAPGLTASDVNVANWAVKGATGPNGCSTKLVVTNGTPNDGPYNSAACGVDEGTGIITAVPEPASIALMGTGLLGLGAGAVTRRRQSA